MAVGVESGGNKVSLSVGVGSSRSIFTIGILAIFRWMDDDRVPSNGVAKNGKEIIIVDDLTPHITAANNKSNGHVANGFHPSSASSSLDDEDDTYGGKSGAKSSNGKEFLTESSVDEECDDDVSEEDDDCAIVEEVGSICNGGGRVAPSSSDSMRPKAAEIRQGQQQQSSPFSSPNTELPAPPPPIPSETGSHQKVLPAATESVPNGQQNRRKHQRPNSSSSSSDSANKGRAAAAEANHSKVQSVVKAPDYGEVCRSRSQDRQRGAPPPPAKLTRRANSGCNGLQSNGNGGGAKSRSQSVDHERVRVERIPGECAIKELRLPKRIDFFRRLGFRFYIPSFVDTSSYRKLAPRINEAKGNNGDETKADERQGQALL